MTKTPRKTEWALADAKSHLSEIVERAAREGPQRITRHGKPAAVVVSIDAWRRLTAHKKPLVAFLREGLSGLEIVRDPDAGRDVDL